MLPPTDPQIAEMRRLARAARGEGWSPLQLAVPGLAAAKAAYIAAANPQAVLALLDALQAAREALDKYGKHHQGCDMYQSFKRETGRCYCGLSDTRAALPQAAAEERGDG